MSNADKSDSEVWQQRFELATSTLAFSRKAENTLDTLLLEMLKNNRDLGLRHFSTEKGRPCVLILAIGETAAECIETAFDKATTPNG